jgi:8-oxo-dGTP pyrophosphatase MutT (NUDIX family)
MSDASERIRQAAALIVHRDRVCLVTATSGRRWILPKGTLEPGQTAGECAAIEAWEEAGVRGRPARKPLAKYESRKSGRPSIVSVFRLDIQAVESRWPERDLRRRRWVSFARAIALVDVPEIRDLLRAVRKSKRKISPRQYSAEGA